MISPVSLHDSDHTKNGASRSGSMVHAMSSNNVHLECCFQTLVHYAVGWVRRWLTIYSYSVVRCIMCQDKMGTENGTKSVHIDS